MDFQLAGITDVYWLEQVEAEIRAEDDWLNSAEIALLKTMHFAKRRDDWRLGRWTAKRALAAYLDIPDHPRALATIEVRPRQSGAPRAFFANRPAPVSISLSHRSGSAICAIAPCGTLVGCDLELTEPRAATFVEDYFTPAEQALVAGFTEVERNRIITLLWSAKESALKALCVGLQQDTRNVTVTFGNEFQGCNEPHTNLLKSVSLSHVPGWRPLSARHADGQIFRGWWQNTDFVRTIVSSPPPALPKAL
jgi:phosphopantetheinyl transferase